MNDNPSLLNTLGVVDMSHCIRENWKNLTSDERRWLIQFAKEDQEKEM